MDVAEYISFYSRTELREMLKELGLKNAIKGFSTMKKTELVFEMAKNLQYYAGPVIVSNKVSVINFGTNPSPLEEEEARVSQGEEEMEKEPPKVSQSTVSPPETELIGAVSAPSTGSLYETSETSPLVKRKPGRPKKNMPLQPQPEVAVSGGGIFEKIMTTKPIIGIAGPLKKPVKKPLTRRDKFENMVNQAKVF